MKQSIFETLIGFLVLCLAAWFFIFAYNTSDAGKTSDDYVVFANFRDIDGISEGSDIRIAGIKVGYVGKIHLDIMDCCAKAQLHIGKEVKIPTDSRAMVATTGILGSKYIKLEPGVTDDYLADGGEIEFTQSSINIESLINKILYSITSK